MANSNKQKKTLKILHVCGSHNRTGTEKVFLRLINAQMKLPGYEVLPLVAENSWLAARLTEREIPHQTAPFKTGLKALFDKQTRGTIEETLAAFKPDVVQNWAGRWSRFIPRTPQPQVARMGLPMPKKYVKNADYVVCATDDVCQYLRKKGLPEAQTVHIPTIVNIPPKGFEDFRYDVRAEYGIPHEAHLVLLLGRLHESKGFDVALFALNTLPENVHMLIVGEGGEKPGLEDAVAVDDLGHRVHFAGWIDNTSPIFAAADSFLLPSRRQSSCNVILEAWAHKLPVISTDIPAARALVTDKEDGILIPPEDELAIARAVETLLADQKLQASLAKAGEKHVLEVFAEKHIVDKYDALYKKAVKEGGAVKNKARTRKNSGGGRARKTTG